MWAHRAKTPAAVAINNKGQAMKRRIALLLVSTVIAHSLAGCAGNTQASDAGHEPDSRQADDASHRDLALVGDDLALAHDAAADGGSEPQGPVEFLFQNDSGKTLYVNFPVEFAYGFTLDRMHEGQWEDCNIDDGCKFECTAENKGDTGCVMCDISACSHAIPSGEAVSYHWNGKLLEHDPQHKACGCYWHVDPPAGRYRVSFCMNDAITCNSSPCPEPDEGGCIATAFPAGNRTCSTVEFSIPYAEDTLTVSLH